ncbi:MAG: LamG-like jellyroll fold domain-containing protein [Planctomycetota bacterium]
MSDTLIDTGLDAVVDRDAEVVVEQSTEDAIEFAHTEALELTEGAFAAAFTLDSVAGRQTLFSKDHGGLQEGGHLTVSVVDGRVEARLQSAEKSVRLFSAVDAIGAAQQHQVAVSFGEDGFRLYVDGLIADAAVDFDQGIAANDNSLYLGASTASRQGDDPRLRDPLDGVIDAFAVYTEPLSLGAAEVMAGVDEAQPSARVVIDGVTYGTDNGEMLTGSHLLGEYGDDYLQGTLGDDYLEAGHGEDIVVGGDGDDLIVSRSDGREPVIAQNYDADDDPNGEINSATKTLYPDQPITSDDHLTGGAGADTFRFEILINAKERILFKHVNDDGTIDWQGVTGENNQVHDHWIDRLGDEVIADFDRSEGDKIEFVGHTVDVYKVEHVDSDGDGVLDASVMHVQSNQGNAGAHNKDQIGTVTVYGDLVTEADYHVHAHANLGIVETIGELGEALAPRLSSPVVSDGASRFLHANVNEENPLPEGAVFSTGQPLVFNGETGDAISVASTDAFALDEGAIVATFSVDDPQERQTLFSKDHSDYQDGGHLTAWVVDGRLEVRFQSDSESEHLHSEYGAIVPGEEHHFAFTFGDRGARLYLDGDLVDAETEFTQTLSANDNPLVIGASAIARQGDNANLRDPLTGDVLELAVYDTALSARQINALAGPRDVAPTPTEGTTGTGLDAMVDTILSDPGLQRRIPNEEILVGAAAADGMNALIVEAIVATGVANDGELHSADMRDVNTYLRENHLAEWTELHGDDEDGVETGFHLVQGDGASTLVFGDSNAINTVADGSYHLGFEIDGNRLQNEDGNNNATLDDVSFWLSEYLDADLAAGALANEAVDLSASGTTGTGLDAVVELIAEDRGLNRRVATSEIVEGAEAADGMNALIVEAIRETDVAFDGRISRWDVFDISRYLRRNHSAEWTELHGDDEEGVETGFHLVQGDGADTQLFGDENAVNTVADGLYHLGFGIRGGRLINEDGDANASVRDVAYWLNELLEDDLRAGTLVEEAAADEALATFA